ncbi:exoribonuclease R [Erwinia amylovora Ea644]|nr:exoribonuclease R [Erwinia amylovora Ea644]
MEVRVDAVHMDERKIDFALISSSRKPRGEGKTEREREKAKNSGSRRRSTA